MVTQIALRWIIKFLVVIYNFVAYNYAMHITFINLNNRSWCFLIRLSMAFYVRHLQQYFRAVVSALTLAS